MDILVKHNGTNVTSDVISYEREHKICTGIGTLTIEFTRTTNRTFDPWDSIDIHENGDFKVRYYISAIKDSIPDGKITLDCQDLSKKLVDFFIPESYLIDYPSYTRYWIEFFLNMADVNYQFETSSPGQLLSNFTSLGMMTAYEQLLVLLQLSGWYMFFDGNGTAIIGPLDADLADDTYSVDGTDILQIGVNYDDRMLRNRALVLGSFDVYSLSYAVADITVKTRWNYDSNDIRTMVVANSNIPNNASAYSIANLLLKEFARITVEKRIEIEGARSYTLGDALRVRSNVWKGKGLITTFGVRMSKNGLVTDVVLDERCPRLFGFFDYGDYVYVGTYGDGIWRKHIKFDPTWYDFSTGLDELRITDLHINNGVFGSVGASGQMFLSTGGDWSPVTVASLPSSVDDIIYSGETVYSDWSPVMARAVIVDKFNNNIKFGVDTWSGLNMGDYFMMYSGLVNSVSFSGITVITGTTISGSHRGWILEYDPYTQALVGGLGSGIYPVHWSGHYDLTILDIENDGHNDYVSIRLNGEAAALNFLGRHETQPFASTYDPYNLSTLPADGRTLDTVKFNPNVTGPNSLITIDNALDGVPRVMYQQLVGLSGGIDPQYRLVERKFAREYDEEGNYTIQTTTTSSSILTGTEYKAAALHYAGENLYILYYYSRVVLTGEFNFYRRVWNAELNILGSEELVGTIDVGTSAKGTTGKVFSAGHINIVTNNTLYVAISSLHHAPSAGGRYYEDSHAYIDLVRVSLATGDFQTNMIFHYVTEQYEAEPTWTEYEFFGGFVSTLHQSSSGLRVLGWMGIDYFHDFNPVDRFARTRDFILNGDETGVSETGVYDQDVTDPIDFVAGNSIPVPYLFERSGMSTLGEGDAFRFNIQLNASLGVMVLESSTLSSQSVWGFNYDGIGPAYYNASQVDDAWWLDTSKMRSVYVGNLAYYYAKDPSGNYWLSDSLTRTTISQITPPSGWTLRKPLTTGEFLLPNTIYWAMENENFDTALVPATLDGNFFMEYATYIDTSVSNRNRAGMIAGSFIIEDVDWSSTSANSLGHDIEIIYLNLEGIGGYMVLQREGMDYNLIQRDIMPIRLDISNSTPLLTVTSGDYSFQSHYIYGDTRELIYDPAAFNPLLSGYRVDDYRYSLLEPVPSGALPSGMGIGVSQMGLFISGSGIYSQDIRTYSGGWQPMFSVPSGYGTRLETSNYGLGGQYIFITSSGFVQTFYQMNPGQGYFVPYSGMPQSRATIIRLDDRI